MRLSDKLVPGRTEVHNLRTGKSGVFLCFKRRADGVLLVRVKFGKVRAYVKADNCAVRPVARKAGAVLRMRNTDRLVNAGYSHSGIEERCKRKPECRHYDACLGAVAKFNALRMRCDRCRGDTPIDATLCEAVSMGLVHVRRIMEG